jgi:hypothetical protein
MQLVQLLVQRLEVGHGGFDQRVDLGFLRVGGLHFGVQAADVRARTVAVVAVDGVGAYAHGQRGTEQEGGDGLAVEDAHDVVLGGLTVSQYASRTLSCHVAR